ncbi:MAG: recombinase family protein, partial [Planctomycetes bacterium]|nr:recombinase family protein [Planctomycetota bacterium]
MKRHSQPSSDPTVRCAIYTRKSTEEGLEQEFNSLDAQRESGESFIASQRHEGWQCLPEHYDDGGFTGANMVRPALRRLLADIESGRVDCVVVYKVDRLSRSLSDFARMMEVFEQHKVSFVSVTQQFNTATSMGRLVLNVLLSFAQFEREIISERVRDKIAASRRKGKWSGGMPLLGYTVKDTKLVVHKIEAERVRQIFEMYLEYQSLLATATELSARGWTTKHWTTKKGVQRGGRLFTKNNLYALLTNVTYIGQIRYKDEVHRGAHEPLVSDELFRKAQALLERNGHTGGGAVRNKHGALLRGLLRCRPCGCAMSHTYTSKGNRRYRYYVCGTAQQRGWSQCVAPSVPAGEIERFVVEQIRGIGRDPVVIAETVRQVRRQTEEDIERLGQERAALQQQLRDHHAKMQVAAAMTNHVERVSSLADVQQCIRSAERRLTEIENELITLRGQLVDEGTITEVLADFDQLWDSLAPREQARVLELLIERVDYDGQHGN